MLVEVIWVSGCRVQLKIWGLRVLGLLTIGFRVADVTPSPLVFNFHLPQHLPALIANIRTLRGGRGVTIRGGNERYRAHIHQGPEQGGMLQKP